MSITLEIGKKLWCLSPSSESASYSEHDLQPPWLGVIVSPATGYNPPGFKLCRVSEHFPKGYDEDTNASCYIDAGTPLYETEPEAIKAYASLKMQEIHDNMQTVRGKLRDLKEFCIKNAVHLPGTGPWPEAEVEDGSRPATAP